MKSGMASLISHLRSQEQKYAGMGTSRGHLKNGYMVKKCACGRPFISKRDNGYTKCKVCNGMVNVAVESKVNTDNLSETDNKPV